MTILNIVDTIMPSKKKKIALENMTASEKHLYENLKLARYVLAWENDNIEKEYWIASDNNLIDLAIEQPQSKADFLEIFWLWEKKYNLCWELFIAVIIDFLNYEIIDSRVQKYYDITEDSDLIKDLKIRKEKIKKENNLKMFNLLLKLDKEERDLFDKLYEYRESILKKTKAFRFMLDDTCLIKIVEFKPASKDELMNIEWFWEKCYELFWEWILEIINC